MAEMMPIDSGRSGQVMTSVQGAGPVSEEKGRDFAEFFDEAGTAQRADAGGDEAVDSSPATRGQVLPGDRKESPARADDDGERPEQADAVIDTTTAEAQYTADGMQAQGTVAVTALLAAPLSSGVVASREGRGVAGGDEPLPGSRSISGPEALYPRHPAGVTPAFPTSAEATSDALPTLARIQPGVPASDGMMTDRTSLRGMLAANPVDGARPDIFATTVTTVMGGNDPAVATIPGGQGPAHLANTAIPPPQPSPHLPMATSFAQPQWGQEFGQQVQWIVGQNMQRAELLLHPAHLGTVEISIVMQHDQLQVSLQSHHPQVREAMEAVLPKLRESLQQGAPQTPVAVDVSSSGREGDARAFSHRADRPRISGTTDDEPSVEPIVAITTPSQGSRLLDRYV